MNDIKDYFIHENLPESLNRQYTKEFAQMVDEFLHRFDGDIHKVLIYPVIDQLSGELVDALAVQLHCDFYDYSLPLDKRRALVKNSIAWHRIKGTKGIVSEMVGTVWGGCDVEEWFEYDGQPYHFRVINITASHVDEEVIRMVLKAIRLTKNVRSWLDEIWFLRNVDAPTYYAMLPSYHKKHVAGPRKPVDTNVEVAAYIGMTESYHKKHVGCPRRVSEAAAEATAYAASHGSYHKKIVLG